MVACSKFARHRTKGGKDSGYILLTLMFFVAVLAVAATAVAPMVTFQIQRDREEEMIHRGVQYSRAVRRYFKKFGRFPTRVEELENTNNIRFLRKRYKDPITGKDFKILHLGDVKLSFGAGIAAASPAGVAALGGALQNPALAAQNPALAAAAMGAIAGAQPSMNLNAQQAPSDPSSSSLNANNSTGSGGNPQSSGNNATPGTGSASGFSGPTFGGGPIVGVASTSEKQTIREFNKKNHYNEWQFIYDPGTDRGGLLNAPAQPPLQNAVQTGQQPAPGAAGGVQPIPNQQPARVQPAQQ